MLGTSWECHKVREFALRPMGDFSPVLDHMVRPRPTCRVANYILSKPQRKAMNRQCCDGRK